MAMLRARVRVLPAMIAILFTSGRWAVAEESLFNDPNQIAQGRSALTVSGVSGGLTIPDGRVLPDGTAAFGFSNYLDPRFSRAARGENYLFGMGFLPYVEISGRLTNFGNGHGSMFTDQVLQRDLSASAKVGIPRVFDYQPDIALGITDLSGGAANYRSKYIAASQQFGPVYATLGYARGAPSLDGIFGGAELALGSSGFSLLAERNTGTNSAGVRYLSRPFENLANMRIAATVQRSFGAHASNGSSFDRTTFGLNLVIPFGDNARIAKVPPSSSAWTAPVVPAASATTAAPAAAAGTVPPPIVAAPVPRPSAAPANPSIPPAGLQALQPLQTALEKAGLERVRVGMAGPKLVIEYENHRYNQNEVDAIGIAFGLGARLAPESIKRITVLTKRAGLPLYETSVDRAGFRNFLTDGDTYQVIAGLQSEFRPIEDPDVEWLNRNEGPRGWSRVMLQPSLNSFIGTEVGLFDYSLAASVQGFVPLWKGAEASVDYVVHGIESDNVRNGPFAFASQRSGIRSALLNQSFWITDRLLNTFSVGKLQYDFTGFQNQATYFVPWRDDQIRLEYSRLRFSDAFFQQTQVNAGAFYRLNIQPLDLWVEAGYSRYVGNDHGPSLRISRWFGDIEAQAFLRRGGTTTFAGLQLAFPLTPRQGMRPGITHIEGPSRFAYAIETKMARQGGDNRITRGVAQEIPFVYNAQTLLLNRGRVGEDYMASQLTRMRDAALLLLPLQ